MKVYLDTCTLHHPLDSKSQPRIALEAEAVLAILGLCEQGTVSLVSSDVLIFEVDRNPHPQRKAYVSEVIARASTVIRLNDNIERRARELEGQGLKALDALHLAAAEAEQVDYFCTCDDRFLKRAKVQPDVAIKSCITVRTSSGDCAMTTIATPLTELTVTAIGLLCQEMGVVNTARFLNQFTTGYGNYTEERDQFLGALTVDEIVAEIKHKRENHVA